MKKAYDILVINEGIFPGTLSKVHWALKGQRSEVLYVVLETSGGLPEVGYRIMKLLNANFKTIHIVVPNRAMSTGTLMAFGGDRIHMFYSSSLGPLDLQIEHPSDGSRISTLDVRDTMNTILSHTIISTQKFYQQAYTEFDLGKAAAAKIATDAATKLVQPIVDKIDPYHLHRSFRNSEVGATYATDLLSTRMMKGLDRLAEVIGSHLGNNYSTHNYAITLDEARDKLQLTADDLSQLKQWPEIETHFNSENSGVYYYSVEAQAEKPVAKEGKKA